MTNGFEKLNSVKGLQQKYAEKSICFGCGPANTAGLRINSVVVGDEVHAHWTPSSHHEAFPGMLNGGIIGSLLDCHSNWTAAWHLMNKNKLEHPPCSVTAEYTIKLLRPTPTNQPVQLIAWVAKTSDADKAALATDDRVWIEAKLMSGDKVCATCRGLFVAVKPGHPAYHRW
jgi:acyl-coenzyme A thioesterase PaaI-like protein